MNIYVDIGNSRIKWCVDGDTQATIAQTVEQLETQWELLTNKRPDSILASSVRGEVITEQVSAIADKIFGVEVNWQRAQMEVCGVKNAYSSPDTLGVDRWMALIAARAEYQTSPCIIIDAGTAITVDLLDADGYHRGGVILPGVSLMFDSLGSTGQLRPQRNEGIFKVNALATSTQAAISAGVSFSIQAGLKAVIKQQATQISAKIGEIPILMTGGDAPMIQLTIQPLIYKPMLVLDGLKIVSECAQ